MVILEFSEDFFTDVLVVDYLEITADGNRNLEGRDKIDNTWKMAARASWQNPSSRNTRYPT